MSIEQQQERISQLETLGWWAGPVQETPFSEPTSRTVVGVCFTCKGPVNVDDATAEPYCECEQ